MPQAIEVECVHLEHELMRVRFAQSQLVSDHPQEWGGTGTGPAPGEMILMALASASALAGRQFAMREKLEVAHVGARANMASVQEGLSGHLSNVALPHLTYADRFWRLLEADGRLSDGERGALIAAMAENRVARTIRDGIRLDERVVYLRGNANFGRSGTLAQANHLLRGRTPLPAGEKRIASPAGDWRVSAIAVDERTCLVRAAGSMSVVGHEIADGRGPTPEELLLGGLAACTTIYVARNASFHDIPVELVRVRVRADLTESADEPIMRVEKVAEIAGEFSDQQRRMLEDFAGYCAFGITLARGTPIIDSAVISDGSPSGAPAALAAFNRAAPTPDDPAFCSDGSCCVPVLEPKAT